MRKTPFLATCIKWVSNRKIEVQLEAVLPLRTSGGYSGQDLQRARILIRSLDKFWAGECPLLLWIIARDESVKLIESSLCSDRLRIEVVHETEMLPQLLKHEHAPGWYKQQVLKLAAHKLVNSPFYLILDADLICTQPFSGETLIVEDKALTDWELKSVHAEWWEGSATVLRTSVGLEDFGFSVTPEVLSKHVCRKLLRHISYLYRTDWCDALLTRPLWTEFTLYCLFATQEGYIERFHHGREWMQRHGKAIRSQHNVWLEEHFKTWRPEQAFSPGATGIFMVCQSNTQIDSGKVSRKLRGLLK
jgi:hypothetical protein